MLLLILIRLIRQSANGFFENIEAQAAGGIMWRNIKMQCLLEKILGENFVYGGTGMNVAFPGTVYQHLHSDDSGSNPYSQDQLDVRHRWWRPAMVLAGPLLNEWNNENTMRRGAGSSSPPTSKGNLEIS